MPKRRQPSPRLAEHIATLGATDRLPFHPADDPEQMRALGLALSLRDMPVARSIARDVLTKRERHDKAARHA